MRYVVIRDDDTNALTPVECLERLYRPFLDRGLPVNLATIPDVTTDAHMSNGAPEGFLVHRNGEKSKTVPIGSNAKLVNYIRENSGYTVIQHGLHHDYLEFDRQVPSEVAARLDRGTQLLLDAGLERPHTFVAPYDKLSRASLQEVARRFRVLSTGWYELRRLPYTWWPRYLLKKVRHVPHWRVGQTLLLTHPGCLLSCHRTYSTMLGGIIHYLQTQQLTVLVTHWWEYYRNGVADQPFIEFLHETAAYLATHPEIKVISFKDLAQGGVRLN